MNLTALPGTAGKSFPETASMSAATSAVMTDAPFAGPLAALALALLAAPAVAENRLDEIVVTATHDALADRREAVTQKTVLDKKEIESLGGLTVGEVIRKLPGIDAGDHSGDGAPSAKARGMGRDAVQFLVDGERPTANARYALTLVGRLPSGELERIEILRGSSAEHGGGAPVTVNLVMRKARPAASTTLKAAVGIRGSSGGFGGNAEPNGQFSLSRGGGSLLDDGTQFSWLLPVTVNHHGMPLDKKTTRVNSNAGTRNLWQEDRERGPYELNELILSPRLTWKKAGDSFTLWPSLYRNEGTRESVLTRSAYANPAAGTGLGAAGGRIDREDSDLTIARLRAEGEMKLAGGSKLSGRAATMGGWRDSDTARTWRDAVGTVTGSREKLGRDEREFSAAVRLDRPVGEAMSSFGLEAATHRREETQAVTGNGAFATKTDASQQQWTAWAQHEWSPRAFSTMPLTLTAGLRGESIRLESDGRDSNAGQLAPSIAARLDAGGGWVARTSAGAGIKAPKLDEISAITINNTASATGNTPLEPDRAGNPDLKAERNVNVELGLERYLDGETGVLGASAYWRRTEDFIERTTLLEGVRWVERPYNQGTARHYGVEFDARLKSELFGFKGGALRAHLTLPKGRVDDERLGGTRDARELPRYQFTLGYEQALPSLSSSAGFQLTKNGRTRTDIPGELADGTTRGTLLDAHWVRKLSATMNLRLSAQNLLRADTRRSSAAWSNLVADTDDWRLASTEKGQITWLLSLEGKW